MVCDRPSKTDTSGMTPLMAMLAVSKQEDWQFTMKDRIGFLCCPDCIPVAYDENGRLGWVKPEYLEQRGINIWRTG